MGLDICCLSAREVKIEVVKHGCAETDLDLLSNRERGNCRSKR